MIDLRSDTVTKPTAPMREAMFNAEVGDDVYSEDPTVNDLEERVAALLDKEAALFVPSGTMANQLAIHLHCRPGESVICEQDSHVFLYEAGAAAANSGVQFDLVPWQHAFSNEAIDAAFKEDSLHSATSRLLVVENTHNRQAGRVLAIEDLRRITEHARSLKLSTHCDGARLWNAAVALEEKEKDLAAGFDTVAVCFSKGLGAPVGSALCGPRDFITKARKIRKRWGGGMRQVGYLAAAARYALDHHRARLKEDHDHAALFARIVRRNPHFEVRYPELGTNMVYVRHKQKTAASLAKSLREKGVLMNPLGGEWLRAVTHLDVNEAAVQSAAQILSSLAP